MINLTILWNITISLNNLAIQNNMQQILIQNN